MKEQSSIGLMIDASLTLQGVRHVTESRYNLISLGALQGKGFSFSFEGDLMEVSKEAHVKFQAKSVGNVYMFRNSKVTLGACLVVVLARNS